DLTDARRHVSRLPSGETAGHSSSTGSDDSDSDEPRLDLDLLAQMQGLREKLDELWNQHRALATSCLVILRIEIRCRCMYYLELTTREGNYGLDAETGEPDQYIQTFNADLIMCEELLAKSLPRDELEFIFSGISYLIANILVTNATRLKDLNRFGVHKMVRNILALQQNLTNISLCSELGMDRALKYYKLFEMNAEAIIQHIHDQGVLFTYDQYKFILDKVYTMTEHATLNTDNYEAEYRKYKASIVELEALFKQPTAMEALASSS
ncbi:exocyst subunit, partial [Dimargaris xerosporica]